MFDPQYDSYACMCRRAGGEVKLVKLNDSDWSVPREEFRAAFSPRTKMVLVNTPHNPTGADLPISGSYQDVVSVCMLAPSLAGASMFVYAVYCDWA